ncbi:MAG TPA: hypothetical protein VE089_00300 [Nitrososphaeraceae archaeon]|nr:hypothetical protein [Nitrososphaeraceae archaeon]
MSLARDCVINKIGLLSNTTVLDNAMRFVVSKQEEVKQEEDTIAGIKDQLRQQTQTINQVF